jgi:hypothetical protein
MRSFTVKTETGEVLIITASSKAAALQQAAIQSGTNMYKMLITSIDTFKVSILGGYCPNYDG